MPGRVGRRRGRNDGHGHRLAYGHGRRRADDAVALGTCLAGHVAQRVTIIVVIIISYFILIIKIDIIYR